MAIFKVITSTDGTSIGHATPQKLEDYLKYEQENGSFLLDENGERIRRTPFVTAQNASAEDFSGSCRMLSASFDTCNDYDSLKYKHYVQGFPPEDNELMTREKCHALGVELAQTLFPDFPVLVVSHFNQEVENTGEYHWHNHFIVYNCAVTDGHKLDTSRTSLWAQKYFVVAQANGNGLTKKGLVLDKDGRILPSTMPDKIDITERNVQKRGQAQLDKSNRSLPPDQIKQRTFLTQKAELRFAVKMAQSRSTDYVSFKKYLLDVYGVKVKESRGSISFLHPERNTVTGWVRGKKLGEAYTKESITNAINEQRNRTADFRRKAAEAGEHTSRSFASGNAVIGAGGTVSSDADTAEQRKQRLDRYYDLYKTIFEANARSDGKAYRAVTEDTGAVTEDAGSDERYDAVNIGESGQDDSIKQGIARSDTSASTEDMHRSSGKHGVKH